MCCSMSSLDNVQHVKGCKETRTNYLRGCRVGAKCLLAFRISLKCNMDNWFFQILENKISSLFQMIRLN